MPKAIPKNVVDIKHCPVVLNIAIKSLIFRCDIRKGEETRWIYVLGIADSVTIPKKRWKKQVLILIITTNHAVLVALVECLSRNWFVYVPRRVSTSVCYFCSSDTSSRNSDAHIYTLRKCAYTQDTKNPVKE